MIWFRRRNWVFEFTQLRESDITLGQFWRALKTHLFGHRQLQRRVTVFFVRCVQIGLLTYLLTYLPPQRRFCLRDSINQAVDQKRFSASVQQSPICCVCVTISSALDAFERRLNAYLLRQWWTAIGVAVAHLFLLTGWISMNVSRNLSEVERFAADLLTIYRKISEP